MDARVESDDGDRYPTLSADGAAMLRFLREHPHAPIFRNQSGNRLTRADLERVRAHEARIAHEAPAFGPGREPDWLDAFVRRCLADVPAYRGYHPELPFAELPTIGRGDLAADVTRFVPDSVPLDRLIQFSTSGTTGHPLVLPSHPVVAASYLAFHKKALARAGIELRHGRGRVGVVLIGWQRTCFTYVSVTPTMDESGLAKINLHPDDWRDPADRARYLDALAAEVWTGDPLSLAEAMKLETRSSPRAILSTSMTLLPALRQELEQRYRCPVLDVYSLNEVGPVAVHEQAAAGHVLLQPDLHVEILRADGTRAAPGERGEVTVSGGFNFFLPLLRYRTGDQAALVASGGELVLQGLSGRPPVRFRAADGAWRNNVEVTHALKRFALPLWALHQDAAGVLHLRARGTHSRAPELVACLQGLFGAGAEVRVSELPSDTEKLVQYTSDLEDAAP